MQSKKYCITSCEKKSVKTLESLGFCVLQTEAAQGLDEEISRHPDVLMCVTGENKITVHSSQTSVVKELVAAGISVCVAEHSFGAYPLDCAFNLAVTDGCYAGLLRSANPVLVKSLAGMRALNVRQGYAKCSTAFVGKNGVITEDGGIASAFSREGFDVLVIEKGDVYLSEKHYGFFGGATGCPDKKTLFVNGELDFHRNSGEIKQFLEKHSVNYIELKKGRITDVGSLLFI